MNPIKLMLLRYKDWRKVIDKKKSYLACLMLLNDKVWSMEVKSQRMTIQQYRNEYNDQYKAYKTKWGSNPTIKEKYLNVVD